MKRTDIRNLAIIAHVDHGKTTLIDKIFAQTGAFASHQIVEERFMDSNPLEKERGITILSKNTSMKYKDITVNIVDTPGHADFGGEVERVLNLVDGVLLLVDAFEGPMPQTRFVLKKALALNLKPIIVINKIDRPDSRPHEVLDMTFELFMELGASDEQLDFKAIYASARDGYAIKELEDEKKDLTPLLDLIIDYLPPPEADLSLPFRLLVTDMHYDKYIGRLLLGRIDRGELSTESRIIRITHDGKTLPAKISKLFIFEGVKRKEINKARAGDIVLIAGMPEGIIGETLCDEENPDPLPVIKVEDPAVSMHFRINDGPLSGQDGTYVTSRQLRDRLMREKLSNIALQVKETDQMEEFIVSGRGELHLSILIETMRREGYEFAVSRPKVIFKEENGVRLEPIEELTLELPEEHVGNIMEELGQRKAEIKKMDTFNNNIVHLHAHIPTRGLIGFRSIMLTLTRGEGILYHSILGYEPFKGKTLTRSHGVLISLQKGDAVAYSLWKLQDRGYFIIEPGVPVYAGMIVGANSRENDLIVNVCTQKQLTNVRASGKDDAVRIIPHKKLSLEQALEFIEDDELVEITPKNIRLRKRYLDALERKRNEKRNNQ